MGGWVVKAVSCVGDRMGCMCVRVCVCVCDIEGRENKGSFLPGQLGLQEEGTEEGERGWEPGGGGEMVLALGIQSAFLGARKGSPCREESTDFPGRPVAKTPRFPYRGPGFDPWPGN